MSKHPSQEEYEKAKAKHKAVAREKEKMISEDLYALKRTILPKHLKRKVVTGCVVFTAAYLTEELIFRKKVPGIIKFAGAVAATMMAPKLYTIIQDNFLVIGETTTLGEVTTVSPEPQDVEVPEDNDYLDPT